MSDHAVYAKLDELSESPGRIGRWAQAFTAQDPVLLIVDPGSWSPDQVASDASRLFAAFGIGEDEYSARVVVLSGPLDTGDLVRLAERCEAVYGDSPVSGPLVTLPRLDVEELRARLTPPAPVRAYIQTAISGGTTLLHRDAHADREVIKQVFADRQYAVEALVDSGWPGIREAARGAGRTPLIVDLGANIGASAVYFKQVFPQATVAMVEPERENFELLLHNTRHLTGMRGFQNAIASTAGTVDLTDTGKGAWAFQAGSALGAGAVIGQVHAITVDDVIDACGEVEPFLLKVDIEGAEGDLFSAGERTFARFPLVVIELHDRLSPARETSRSFLRWHLQQNRDIYTVGEHIFSISPSLRRGATALSAVQRS